MLTLLWYCLRTIKYSTAQAWAKCGVNKPLFKQEQCVWVPAVLLCTRTNSVNVYKHSPPPPHPFVSVSVCRCLSVCLCEMCEQLPVFYHVHIIWTIVWTVTVVFSTHVNWGCEWTVTAPLRTHHPWTISPVTKHHHNLTLNKTIKI